MSSRVNRDAIMFQFLCQIKKQRNKNKFLFLERLNMEDLIHFHVLVSDLHNLLAH